MMLASEKDIVEKRAVHDVIDSYVIIMIIIIIISKFIKCHRSNFKGTLQKLLLQKYSNGHK